MIVRCPAKINTFLAVGPPDERGWHPLRTTFQEIDLADTLSVEMADENSVSFSTKGIPETNTVTRMRDLLRQSVEVPPLRIHVEKRIPPESGLGGGSSDAGGLMKAILALTNTEMAAEAMRETALKIGADVPFFLVGYRAQAEGYGERIEPLPDLPRCELVLARPNEGCPTGEMFRKLDVSSRPFRNFPETDELYNDFERVAPCASLDLIERLLVHGARDAGLTGSGSVVFGRFDDPRSADRAAIAMEKEAPWVHRGHTITRSDASRTF